MEGEGRGRDSSRHRSASRFALPPALGRVAGVVVPALSLLSALVLGVVVQALSPASQRLPAGEAGFDLAGAWAATEPGGVVGTTSWFPAPTLGRVQLGLAIRLLQGGQAQSVLAAAHGVMVLLVVVQLVLLWWAVRRAGGGALAAGFAAGVFGVAPIAVDTHAAVSATAVGMAWLLASAAILTGRSGRAARAGGGVAAAMAVASAPAVLPAAAGLAVLLVLRVLRVRGRDRSGVVRSLLPVGAGFGGAVVVLAGGMAAFAAAPTTAASRALDVLTASGIAAPAFGAAALARWLQVDPLFLIVTAVAVVLVGARPRGRSLAVLAVLLTLTAVFPFGLTATTPLVVLLPVVAAVIARSVELGVAALGHPTFVRSVLGSGWLTATAVVLVMGVVGWLSGLGGLVPGGREPLARLERWVGSSVPAGQTVLVGLGAWPDITAATRATVGWYAGTPGRSAVPSSLPWSTADYVVTDSSLPADPAGDAAAALDRSLPVARFGSGTAAMTVRAVRDVSSSQPVAPPTTDAGRAALRQRALAGMQLAENPRIEVDGADRARLLSGEVDTRVAVVLAQFVTAHRITVTAFGSVDGDTDGVRTTVTISEIDGRPIPADGAKTGLLLRFLSELRGDLATRSIDATDDGVIATFASGT